MARAIGAGARNAAAVLLFLLVFATVATLLALVLGLALDVFLPRGLARFLGGVAAAPAAAALATAVIDRWPKRYDGLVVLAAFGLASAVAVPLAYLGYIPGLRRVDILAPAVIGLMSGSLLLVLRRPPQA
jgi:small basic protein